MQNPIAFLVNARGPAVAMAVAAATASLLAGVGLTTAGTTPSNQVVFADTTGQVTTLTTATSIDTFNPFFQSLGSNGRACVTCHQPAQAWTLTPAEVRQRFNNSKGKDPLFATNDGANCANSDVSSLAARRSSYSLLMSKGLIRVALEVPAGAEFVITDVQDPYGCGAPLTTASMYRRPLPSTNLHFLSAVMWDGRETTLDQPISSDLAKQALDATLGHAQALTPPSQEQIDQIVQFELGLFTAQTKDDEAGSLAGAGANGGPGPLRDEFFCIGLNDPLGILPAKPGHCDAASAGLNPTVFTIYDQWSLSNASARQAIARGQAIFNGKSFLVDNVGGLNADPADPVDRPMLGTCTLCHNTPNAGDHSIAMALNIGISDASRRTPDLPLYTLRRTGSTDTVQTSDPGRAMVTGRWADIGKVKGPILRALAARAPYFHNGSAATLGDVVDFYDKRFNIGFTAQEKSDLIAFLLAL